MVMVIRRRVRQLELRPVVFGWGGVREGAGRPKKPGAGVPHVRRPVHRDRHPVHATVRLVREAAWLRAQPVFERVCAALKKASGEEFRVLHFSAQNDHLHLVVEAEDARALSRGMKALGVRVARAVNAVLGRRGPAWADRYHARSLESPRAVRNALVYVLHNARKHGASFASVDRFSSAPWFDGYVTDAATEAARAAVAAALRTLERPTAPAITWLATAGWRRLGLLRLDELPRHARSVLGSAAAPR
jgi:REP element-mobilizing transposase RayT